MDDWTLILANMERESLASMEPPEDLQVVTYSIRVLFIDPASDNAISILLPWQTYDLTRAQLMLARVVRDADPLLYYTATGDMFPHVHTDQDVVSALGSPPPLFGPPRLDAPVWVPRGARIVKLAEIPF